MLIPNNITDVRYDYASATVIYTGKAMAHKANTGSGRWWYICKYTLDDSGRVARVEGPLRGNWNDRTSLNWDA